MLARSYHLGSLQASPKGKSKNKGKGKKDKNDEDPKQFQARDAMIMELHVSLGMHVTKQDPDSKQMLALAAKLRRFCMPKPKSGRLDVSPDVHQQFLKGGSSRNQLLQVLYKAGGDKDACRGRYMNFRMNPRLQPSLSILSCLQDKFLKTVEHIKHSSRKNKLHVEAGWYTKERMAKDLGWSKLLGCQAWVGLDCA